MNCFKHPLLDLSQVSNVVSMATSAMATVSSPRHPLGLPGVELVEGGCEHLLHVTTQLQTKHNLVTITIATDVTPVFPDQVFKDFTINSS